MKVKKIRHEKYKVLKLHLLKSRVYQIRSTKNFLNESLNQNLEQSELHIKKALKIIYEYHSKNCKILFIGFPSSNIKLFSNLISNTQHFFIPSNLWINGLLANQTSISQFLLGSTFSQKSRLSLKNANSLLSIKTKPDLVVIFDQSIETDTLKELYNLDIPITFFGSKSVLNEQITYKIPGNFFFINQKVKNIISFLLCSIMKKIPRN